MATRCDMRLDGCLGALCLVMAACSSTIEQRSTNGSGASGGGGAGAGGASTSASSGGAGGIPDGCTAPGANACAGPGECTLATSNCCLCGTPELSDYVA